MCFISRIFLWRLLRFGWLIWVIDPKTIELTIALMQGFSLGRDPDAPSGRAILRGGTLHHSPHPRRALYTPSKQTKPPIKVHPACVFRARIGVPPGTPPKKNAPNRIRVSIMYYAVKVRERTVENRSPAPSALLGRAMIAYGHIFGTLWGPLGEDCSLSGPFSRSVLIDLTFDVFFGDTCFFCSGMQMKVCGWINVFFALIAIKKLPTFLIFSSFSFFVCCKIFAVIK